MEKFIYVFNQDEYFRLSSLGFNFICECISGHHKAYVFENNPKSIHFSNDDRKQLLFSSKMYFIREN